MMLVSSYIIKANPTMCSIQVIPKRKNIFSTVLFLRLVFFLDPFSFLEQLDVVLFDVEFVVVTGGLEFVTPE